MPARETTPLGQPCRKCGLVHEKCAGHKKGTKIPCGQNPQKHQEVCHLHGGKSPQAKSAAQARELEEAALAAVRNRWAIAGDEPVADPLGELARVAGEVVAWKDYLRDQVAALEGVLTYWVDTDYRGLDGEIHRSEATENARAIVTAYERAQDRAAKTLAVIVKLGIAERMLALRSQQAEAIVQAVRDGLGTVDLEPAIRSAALEAIATRLEQISEPPPALPKELTA